MFQAGWTARLITSKETKFRITSLAVHFEDSDSSLAEGEAGKEEEKAEGERDGGEEEEEEEEGEEKPTTDVKETPPSIKESEGTCQLCCI